MFGALLALSAIAIQTTTACKKAPTCPFALITCDGKKIIFECELSKKTLTFDSFTFSASQDPRCAVKEFPAADEENDMALINMNTSQISRRGVDCGIEGNGTGEFPAKININAKGRTASGKPFTLRYSFQGCDFTRGKRSIIPDVEDPEIVIECLCENGGTCVRKGAKRKQTVICKCPPGYTGRLCRKVKTRSKGDPHLKFYVAAIDASVCYNLHGKHNHVVELFTAPSQGLIVNAQFDNSTGPKAKYFDRCAIIMPTWSIIITSDEVNVDGTVYSWSSNTIQIDGIKIKLDSKRLSMTIGTGSGSIDIEIKRRIKSGQIGLDFIFYHQPSVQIEGILGQIESQIVSVDSKAGKKIAKMTLVDGRKIRVKYSTRKKVACWQVPQKGNLFNIVEFTRPCLTCTS